MTKIVLERTKPCLTTLMKHFERIYIHIDVTQRPRYKETLQVYRSLGYAADVLTVSQYPHTRRSVLLSTMSAVSVIL